MGKTIFPQKFCPSLTNKTNKYNLFFPGDLKPYSHFMHFILLLVGGLPAFLAFCFLCGSSPLFSGLISPPSTCLAQVLDRKAFVLFLHARAVGEAGRRWVQIGTNQTQGTPPLVGCPMRVGKPPTDISTPTKAGHKLLTEVRVGKGSWGQNTLEGIHSHSNDGAPAWYTVWSSAHLNDRGAIPRQSY